MLKMIRRQICIGMSFVDFRRFNLSNIMYEFNCVKLFDVVFMNERVYNL